MSWAAASVVEVSDMPTDLKMPGNCFSGSTDLPHGQDRNVVVRSETAW